MYALLKIQIERFGLLNEFSIQRDKILNLRTGSEFLFYGLWRSIDEVKGLEGIDILWIEEAHNLTEDQWEKLNPTIRKEGSQIWVIFNPQLITDFVYKRFIANPPPGTLHRKINYDENPFLSSTMLEVINAAKAEDIDEFAHQYLGEPRQDDDNVIIKRSWIMASIDAHKELGWTVTGRKRIGFDIADSGADKCANVYAHGSVVEWADMWNGKEDELLMSSTRTYKAAQERGASITYDSIGVGAGAGAKFNELNAIGTNYGNTVMHSKFNAGGAVWRPDSIYTATTKNKDQFLNIKAQAWWMVADRFRNTYNAIRNGQKFSEDQMISLNGTLPHLSLLIDELSTPKRDFDQNGRVKVESKKDLAKREVASPNCFIAGTLVETDKGSVAIEDLKIGDVVLTPMGQSKITHLHCNEVDSVISNAGLTGTHDHCVFTWNMGWVPLQTLSLCDKIEPFKLRTIKWQILNRLYTKARCSQFSTRVNTIVQGDTEGAMLAVSDFYIGGFGLKTMAQFLKITMFIILMVTGAITGLKILSASLAKNTKGSIWSNGLSLLNTKDRIKQFWTHLGHSLKSGTLLRRVGGGMQSMLKSKLQKENTRNIFALSANVNFSQDIQCRQKLAQGYVLQKMPMLERNHYMNQFASAVEKSSNTRNHGAAMKIEDAQEDARCQSKRIPVYNITLDRHNVYYANGILVKNCADALIMAFAPGQEAMVISDQALLEMAGSRSR